ncbi:MAG: RNA-binding transcriptional accessory protein [Erysipelotrichaceae bacterium]|nr:RNA-binding transcriptional accessory protein [Erysipelotrichaceae bacterium]
MNENQEEKLIQKAAAEAGVSARQAKAVLDLLAEDATVPFIARYRKEVTGNLDEEQIRAIDEAFRYAKNLAQRKEDVARLIEAQGQLSEEIKEALAKAEKLSEVEDIYRPYKQKKKTRASEARRKGLQPLADWMLELPHYGNVYQEAKKYLNEEVPDAEAALQGARDILAEVCADSPLIRDQIRQEIFRNGRIITKVRKDAKDEKKTYQLYYDHNEPLRLLEPHRTMAIDRAEKENVITVTLDYNKDKLERFALLKMTGGRNGITIDDIEDAVADGLKRLAYPSLEREVRNECSEKAQAASIEVFSENVEKLLLQAPLKGRTVLGFDPGYAHGCKLAVVDKTGRMLEVAKIFPTFGDRQKVSSEKTLLELIKRYDVDIIAIGNGTASRESEAFVADVIRRNGLRTQYTIVSEAGASVYSAGDIARAEFPDLEVEERSAVSIARRILDPLSELIKIDPESIGVGQYQHDLPKKELRQRLDFVVEKAVNRVGADLATASPELLTHVSGLSASLAKNIVAYRNEKGKFADRQDLLKVKGIGAKAFQQCAGFLRIQGGKEVLDGTSIHPESYPTARAILARYAPWQPGTRELQEALQKEDAGKLAEELSSDAYTVADILSALKEPLRDYRDEYDAPLLRSDILKIEDLQVGDRLQGTVRNVVDFGAFVDIGLHDDGLVHRSKMHISRSQSPREAVSVGDIIEVEVLSVDPERGKISLGLLK